MYYFILGNEICKRHQEEIHQERCNKNKMVSLMSLIDIYLFYRQRICITLKVLSAMSRILQEEYT